MAPADAWDFARCYRLLKAIPELRDGLHLLRKESVVWDRLIERWSELERLYEEEKPYPKRLHELMKSLGC